MIQRSSINLVEQNTQQNIRELEEAEKDLRFYTAIIGHRPTVDPTAPPLTPVEHHAADNSDDETPSSFPFPHPSEQTPRPCPDIDAATAERSHTAGRLSLWIRNLSGHARRRFDEACHRLAS